jgi:hypothetical protein
MDIVIEVLIALVPAIIAGAVAIARTTDNKIDDKVAKLAQNNSSRIKGALRSVVDEKDREKSGQR